MAKIKTYPQALDFLFSRLPMFSRVGTPALKPDLNNITKLCDHLGNPQDKIKIIHVAGTNGKGTVSHLTAAMLQSQGYKVGLHVSPHYKDIRERFKVNGQFAPKRFVIDFLNKLMDIIDSVQPSFFELTVAMAFEYFYQAKVDYAVIEVGLGGRLDSTNIVRPILSVITNISFDHMDLLGDTLPKIAYEKAGIIKSNIPIIIGEYQEEVAPIFDAIAKERKSEIVYARDTVKAHILETNHEYLHIDALLRKIGKINFDIDLSGPFQHHNLITSLAILDYLFEHSIVKELDLVFHTLLYFRKSVRYLGRWQVLCKKPLIIADSAHNIAGLTYVLDRLQVMKKEKLHIVLGFVKDKSREEILSKLPTDAQYYFVNANIPRALAAPELQTEALQYNLYGQSFGTVKEGFVAAKGCAGSDDIIFIGGSIFVVAEVL